MKFRVTSIVWEDCFDSIVTAGNTLQDWLNASLGDGLYGDGLDQVTFVVVATEEDPTENANRASIHDKLGKYTDMINSVPVRHLSFGISLPYNSAVSLSPEQATEAIARLILQKVSVRPKRLPKGFDFQKLSNSIKAAVQVFCGAV